MMTTASMLATKIRMPMILLSEVTTVSTWDCSVVFWTTDLTPLSFMKPAAAPSTEASAPSSSLTMAALASKPSP